MTAQPKLSKASKMPCRSWSLEALTTCPASKDSNGELVPACKGCYATTGNYRFPNVKAPRLHNQSDWKKDDWVSVMVAELDNDRYFRWFDSGDMYDIRLAKKILAVMRQTPWVKHWLPTRMHKFDKFQSVIEQMQQLPNVVVRLSSDGVQGEIVPDAPNTSTIIPTISHKLDNMTLCQAYEREGKCGTCRACWDKTISVVAYPAHGAKMLKQIKDLIQTVEVV
tara:strand:- start:105 stop:773 length:669 start_codon:yes stop_codon:yes gene_type:complete